MEPFDGADAIPHRLGNIRPLLAENIAVAEETLPLDTFHRADVVADFQFVGYQLIYCGVDFTFLVYDTLHPLGKGSFLRRAMVNVFLQAAAAVRFHAELSQEDWFAYTDNFGTSEEKAFVAYFKGYVDDLRKIYNKVYLVRNERVFHLYSFEDGERFEPDYVLFLQKEKTDGYEQIQIFVEPKGNHLLEKDE